jgi:hypothetical protein
MNFTSSALCFTLILLAVMSSDVTADTHILKTTSKTIELDKSQWTKLKDEYDYAKNYTKKDSSPWHQYNQTVTVYLIPMSADRRIGLKVSDTEYIEIFLVHSENYVTVQTRVDKNKYWVLSRETFKLKGKMPFDITGYQPILSEKKTKQLLKHYQLEIDKTRYLINDMF